MVVQRLLKCLSGNGPAESVKTLANGPAESVKHSIDCKENYLGLEMPMCTFVSLAALLQKLPLNKSPGPDCISAEHLLYADESLRFFSQ